jgi:hypothetical protein
MSENFTTSTGSLGGIEGSRPHPALRQRLGPGDPNHAESEAAVSAVVRKNARPARTMVRHRVSGTNRRVRGG